MAENYIYSSKDFGKTKSYLEVSMPDNLIHKNVTGGNQDGDFSTDRKHPVHIVNLPTRAISMSIGGLEVGQSTRNHRHSYETIIYFIKGRGHSVVEGQRVFEGDELVTIAKNTVPHIVAYLDPKYLEDAVKGANALVKFPNGSSFEAEVSDSVEVVSKLPSQLVSPFEGQPAYLKVVLDFITAPPEEYWVEGMTVEARF